MRYISIKNLKEGMVLGKALFGQNGQLLLAPEALIKREYVSKIQSLGYPGIYIKDSFSDGIEISEIISPELKANTIKKLKDIYIATEIPRPLSRDAMGENLRDMRGMVSTIVDDILENKDVLINIMDLKVYDDYTYYHSLNVAVLSVAIGAGIGLNKETLNALGVSAVLHDIGKKFVSKDILEKCGKLTDQEFEIIKEHTTNGYLYIRENFNLSSVSNVAILQHHERFDGSGYPLGKKENDITAFARILAVVDVYDALTSKRPYHEAMLPHLALEYIEEKAGELFDPNVVSIFLKKIAPYPVGMEVELSNGIRGIVVKNYEDAKNRPLLKLITDDEEIRFVNLRNSKLMQDVEIVKIAE